MRVCVMQLYVFHLLNDSSIWFKGNEKPRHRPKSTDLQANCRAHSKFEAAERRK